MTKTDLDQAKSLLIMPIAMRLGIVVNERSRKIHCPFHTEKTASCELYPTRYHCFGCGADGSTIDLVIHLTGSSLEGAIEFLNGTSVLQAATPPIPIAAHEPTRIISPRLYRQFWQSCLPGSYLEHKGLNSRQFGIRLTTPKATTILPDFKAGGLFIPYYQNGHITYGRWRSNDPNVAPTYKIRGPKGVALKLYGQDSLSNLPGRLYLTESETDQMTLHALGKAAVAFPGAASVTTRNLFGQLLRLISSHPTISHLVLALDNDEAGRKGSLKLIAALQQAHIDIPLRRLNLEDYKDVNEAFNNGVPL